MAGGPLDVPARQWTKDELSRYIEQRFLSGDVPDGAALPSERSLSEAFDVSRPFVREVLSGLQQRGRVDIRPGRGIFVREPGITDVARAMRESARVRTGTPRTLVEARLSLEKQTAALAAARASTEEMAAVERALDAFDSSEHLIERARADIAFHSLIVRASGNPVLETMFGSIAPFIFTLMLRSLADPDTTQRGAPYHGDLLRALKDRDPERAEAAAAAHICVAEQTFGDDFDRRLDLIARQVVQRHLGRDIPVDDIISTALEDFTNDGYLGWAK